MAKAEISWRRITAEGVRLQVYARHVGREWRFFARQRRYDPWQAIPEPPLEDWLELLDAVGRRINRRLLRPEEEARVRNSIRERFPEAKLEDRSGEVPGLTQFSPDNPPG
ncbi:MAG: hypothetical protein ABSD29_25550 [Verrucomicrobiota bacterium]|jgi:hypothetical protein